MYKINHIHIRSEDPAATAEWYVKAFNFKIIDDTVRDVGDRFLRCESEGGLFVNISGPRTGETLAPGHDETYVGLEHFGVYSENLEADLVRLKALGARIAEPPRSVAAGIRIAFVVVPGQVRVELMQKG